MKSADWLAERFGLGGPASLEGPVDRGFQGRVWRLTCGARAYAVKEALVPLDHDQVVAAYALQQRAETAGAVAPRQLLTVAGDPAVYVDGETLRIFEWLELAPPDRDLDAIGLGRLLARLHIAGGPTSGAVDPWFVDPVGRDRWVELVAELRLAGAPFATTLGTLVDELAASEAVLEEPRDLTVCHRDLWADNVLRTADGELVVLDWENSGPGSPTQELGVAMFEFGCGEPDRMRTLGAAYVAAGGPGRLTCPEDLTMLVAQTGHIAQIGCERWLAATTDGDRADNADWVAEFLDEPVTAAVIETILGAAAG